MEELRIEIGDLKHAVHTMQVDTGLLEERFRKQDKPSNALSLLEKRIVQLEKKIDKASSDLRTLNGSLQQVLSKIQNVETELFSHSKRLEEVTKLKGTLTSISKAMGNTSEIKTYLVKAGDSLEKIARVQHVSVETLRKINRLSTDKIIVGQELRLSGDP